MNQEVGAGSAWAQQARPHAGTAIQLGCSRLIDRLAPALMQCDQATKGGSAGRPLY